MKSPLFALAAELARSQQDAYRLTHTPFSTADDVTRGTACVDCFTPIIGPSYRLFSGRPNTSRDSDKRARCQSCACRKGVVSALKDRALPTEG